MVRRHNLQAYTRNLRDAFSHSWVFLTTSILANISNLIFSIYLGKILSLSDFSIIAFFTSMMYVVNVGLIGLTQSVNHALDKHGNVSTQSKNNIIYTTLAVSIIWLVCTPLLGVIFDISSPLTLALFTPVFIFGLLLAFQKGTLQHTLKFEVLGVAFLSESLAKLLAAVTLVSAGLEHLAYLSIPFSIAIVYISLKMFLPLGTLPKADYSEGSLSLAFFASATLTSLATISFLSIDVLLVKLFFEPELAGEYALLALTGKILFFFGSILSGLIIPLVSKQEHGDQSTRSFSSVVFGASFLLIISSVLFFVLYGKELLIMAFGQKVDSVIHLVSVYSIAIGAFTSAYMLVLYHLARQRYIYPLISAATSIVLLFGMFIYHNTLDEVVMMLFYVSVGNLLIMGVLSLLQNNSSAGISQTKSAHADRGVSITELHKPTVTIGISALNEEKNIARVVRQLLNQERENFRLEKVLIVSDGSTDRTVAEAKSIKSPLIEVVACSENKGKSSQQNYIREHTTSDILVIFDADILINNNQVLNRLVAPIIHGDADLTSCWPKPLSTPKTFIEKVLTRGFYLKYDVYTKFKKGNNLYTCVGSARAFSKDLYTHITFPTISSGEDQYSYFFAVSNNYAYKAVHNADMSFRLPTNLKDYRTYALRIFQTQTRFSDIFDESFISEERKLPKTLIIKAFITSFIKNPLLTITYALLHMFMQQWALLQPRYSKPAYPTAVSTKDLL